MKGLILAGGKGTRLTPLTEFTNKHLLPVGREPMIWHPVRKLIEAGITEILIITSNDHSSDLIKTLGSGKRFGCDFTYRIQEEAGGIADALALGENFTQGNKIIVMLGDNIFEYPITSYVQAFQKQKAGARIILKEVDNPERFGVAVFNGKQIISIEEKPVQPRSNFAVTGCYMYDEQVFDLIRLITPSARGEMEITDVNNLYIKQGQIQYDYLFGNWIDAGTFESLNEANNLMLVNYKNLEINKITSEQR